MNDIYNHEFFPKDILARTKKLQLYNINLQLNIYEQGIRTVINSNRNRFLQLARQYVDLDRIQSSRDRVDLKKNLLWRCC